MTSQNDFLKKIIDALDEAQIPYMVSGSVGSSFHGRPRATNDADIVILATEDQLNTFAQSLGKDYYLSLQAMHDAYKNNSMFNVIDIQAGWKADFIIRKKRLFSEIEFERRRSAKIMGLDICVVSPEDAILSKLEWAKDSGSDQQFQDALGVAVVQGSCLDYDYLSKWAKELDLDDALEQLLKQAKE